MFVQNGSKMEECKNRSLAEHTVGMFLYHIVRTDSDMEILFLGFYPKIYFSGGSLYSYIFVFFKMYYITKRLCDKTI